MIAGRLESRRWAIGVDLGGTKTEALLLDPAGRERWRLRQSTPQGDYAATLQGIAQLVIEARAQAGRLAGSVHSGHSSDPGDWGDSGLRLAASALPTVGLAHPGSLNADGRLKNANSTCLNGRPVQADLQALLGQPVALANDANCLALSEATDGAAAGADVVFAVILGTGVGGGMAVGGRVLPGANGLAGEWGHNPLPWWAPEDGPPLRCWCGQYGCVETWCSGPALARLHAREPGAGAITASGSSDTASGDSDTAPGGSERPAPGLPASAHALAQAAVAGNTHAAASIRRWQHRLARALAGVINLLDPDVIVLGGGLSQVTGTTEAVERLWGQWVFNARGDGSQGAAGATDLPRTRLRLAQHGDSSGIRGAAWLGARAV